MRPEWVAQVSRLLIETMKERDELRAHLQKLGAEVPKKSVTVSDMTFQQILLKCINS